ncbi:hypothetical protein BX666DRAFT_2026415 [Dichotomocladium elegans]|nr:hypothetical protein BX666DRAFT_2026415 [Dichotomocladium elegans]
MEVHANGNGLARNDFGSLPLVEPLDVRFYYKSEHNNDALTSCPKHLTLSKTEEFLYRTSVRFTITYNLRSMTDLVNTTMTEIPKLYVSLYPWKKDPNIIYPNNTRDTDLRLIEIDDCAQRMLEDNINTIVSVELESFEKITEREFKVNTVVNVFRIVGGIAGILVSIQACFFDRRLKSPGGSSGDSRLARFVDPCFRHCNPDFKSSMSRSSVASKRFACILILLSKSGLIMWKSACRMLERVLAAYYLNSEVLRHLRAAVARRPSIP